MTRLASKARKGGKTATGATGATGATVTTQVAAPAEGGRAGEGRETEESAGVSVAGEGRALGVEAGVPAHGTVIEVPLSRLKRSPRNARRTPHTKDAIEALAGSIAAKGMLQKPVVEPEVDEAGAFTGSWLVTIGEGRRLAQALRVERGEIGEDEPVSCVVDLANDPQEISLDENVTREDLHPLDQFEAFLDQAERLGRSAEEIAARFGVTPVVVRRRLKLAKVSPVVREAYREGQLDLEALMAFAVSDDHRRQEQVFQALPPFRVDPGYIRRLMTETKVPACDRRVEFVGIEAYEAAGGRVLRDLFTEDRGGWLEDVALLEALALEKLAAEAGRLRDDEGWKWAEAHIDYPYHLGFARTYPVQVERTPEETARMAALSEEYDALLTKWDHLDEVPPEVEARFKEIDAELQAFGDGYAYPPEAVARGGLFVMLGHDGGLRVERGFIRPEDAEAPEDGGVDGEGAERDGDGAGSDRDGAPGDGSNLDGEGTGTGGPASDAEPQEDPAAPLSAALVAELSAYRTAGLRDALAENPDAALVVTVHALALQAFYGAPHLTCADLRTTSASLTRESPQVGDCPAMRRIGERQAAWARDLPPNPAGLWPYVAGLDRDSLLSLLAHCVGQSLNGLRGWEQRRGAWAHADDLAACLKLDMTTTWTATAQSYFGRVTKARIAEAVREAVSEKAAGRLDGLKKPAMAALAEELTAGTGWLPELLRTRGAAPAQPATGGGDDSEASTEIAVLVAAE